MIEMLHERGDSKTGVLTFRWQGMSILMEGTVDLAGKKCLTLRMVGVGAAVRITDSITENWTISVQAESINGVGVLSQDAALICVGPAQNVTANATAATQDSEK